MPNLIPAEPHLVLYFENQKPISADALSKLLGTMAKDFARFRKGAELVVVGVEQGSLKIVLRSAAAAAAIAAGVAGFAGGANDIIDFGSRILTLLERAEYEHAPPARPPGIKSAKAVLETAVASKSRFTMEYRNAEGEELSIKMEAPEAERRLENLAPPPDPPHLKEKSPRRLPGPRTVLTDQRAASDSPDVEALLATEKHRLLRSFSDGDATGGSAIWLIIETLQANGETHALWEIEHKLRANGLFEIADMVAQARGGQTEGFQPVHR